MSKIVITIYDDSETGGVKYESELVENTSTENEPTPALLIAHSVLMYMQGAFNPEAQQKPE